MVPMILEPGIAIAPEDSLPSLKYFILLETGQSHVVVAETLEASLVVTMLTPDHPDEGQGAHRGHGQVPGWSGQGCPSVRAP